MQGVVLSYGNTGQEITVLLRDGENVQAIAKHDINNGFVSLLYDPDLNEYSAYVATPDIPVLTHIEGVQSFPSPESPEIPPDVLPFQVLFFAGDEVSNVQLGGDRPQEVLAGSGTVLKGGISNRGNLEYVAVWLEEPTISRSDNGLLLQEPAVINEDFYTWVGSGYLNANLYPVTPEENFNIEVIGDPLVIPFGAGEISFRPPLYPRPAPYLISVRNEGVTNTTQIEGDYSYSRVEDYDYKTVNGGTSGLDPSPAFPSTFCGFGVSFTVLTFTRESGMNYESTIDIINDSQVQTVFNNLVFGGPRLEFYIENFDYTQTSSINPGDPANTAPKFSTVSSFDCVEFAPGVYLWTPSANRIGIFRGEDHITSISKVRVIDEPEWDKPITLVFTRKQKHLLKEDISEDVLLSFPEETWSINPFDSTFEYPVQGIEIKDIITSYTEERFTPIALLAAADNSAALFTEKEEIRKFTIDDHAKTPYTKYNDIDIILPDSLVDPMEVVNEDYVHDIVTTVVDQKDIDKFYLALGTELTEISLDDSWFFKIVTDNIIDGGLETLSNDDATPIFSGNLNRITSYIENRDVIGVTLGVPNAIFYPEVEEEQIAFWGLIDGAQVYIVQGNTRYRAEVLSVTSVDTEQEDLAIQKIRTINEIMVQITAQEEYPFGLAEEGEIIVYPIANCSRLLYDHILGTDNRIFANIVGNIVYFSKSVTQDYSLGSQRAEVFTITNVVTQEAPVTGAFTPITGVEVPLGISYSPP